MGKSTALGQQSGKNGSDVWQCRDQGRQRSTLWPAIWLLKYRAWLHPGAKLEPHLLVQRTVFVADQNIFETIRVGDEQFRIAGVAGDVEHQVGEVRLSRPQRRGEGCGPPAGLLERGLPFG